MAEVGLLPFARVALEVATQVLPPYRTRFSKHQFTQPQLLAVLCLMRYEDWTFREAETRLREHQELRAALKLREVPDYTTLYRFLRRLTTSPWSAGWAKRCDGCADAGDEPFLWPLTARGFPTIPSAPSLYGAWNSMPIAVRAIVIG